MKLTIKNLGPLTKGGSIDLDKRFYVFVGQNNSGKTYVANVMARLFDTQKRLKNLDKTSISPLEINSEMTELELKKETVEDMAELLCNWLRNDLSAVFNTSANDFEKTTLKLTKAYDVFFSKKLDFEFPFAFASEHTVNDSTASNIHVVYVSKLAKSASLSFRKENMTQEDFFSKPHINYRASTFIVADEREMNVTLGEMLNISIAKSLLPIIFSSEKEPNPLLLPAHRSFFTSFWKYIFRIEKNILDEVGALVRMGQAIPPKLLKQPYNASTNELIKALEDLDRNATEKPFYSDLLSDLEEIMGGEVVLSKGVEGGIGRMEIKFKIKESGQELDMFMASSSVNQLTVLYLYLKYWVQESNNFLIIDEPEENLHPENQVKLVNLLMKFADRNNNKVLITTHSSLVTEAVNNYVRIGYLKDEGVDLKELLEGEESGLHQLAELSKEDFGVYYFGEGAIKEYEIDEFGVFFRDFAKIEDDIRNTANLLKDKIYKSTRPRTKKE